MQSEALDPVQRQLQIGDSHRSSDGTPQAKSTVPQGNGTPWKTPAPVFAEPKTPATAVAASGWQELCCEEGAQPSNAVRCHLLDLLRGCCSAGMKSCFSFLLLNGLRSMTGALILL